jgi:hypothetical protein
MHFVVLNTLDIPLGLLRECPRCIRYISTTYRPHMPQSRCSAFRYHHGLQRRTAWRGIFLFSTILMSNFMGPSSFLFSGTGGSFPVMKRPKREALRLITRLMHAAALPVSHTSSRYGACLSTGTTLVLPLLFHLRHTSLSCASGSKHTIPKVVELAEEICADTFLFQQLI